MKNFLFILGISHMSKKNVTKMFDYLSWKLEAFPTKLFLKNVSMIFFVPELFAN